MVYPHTYRTEHSETKTSNSTYGDYHAQQQRKKIHIQPELLKILQFVDSNRKQFVSALEEAVQIRSVSGDPAFRSEMYKMKKFIENWLIKLNVKYECFNIGYEEVDGERVRLPPVILGTVHSGADKKTICVYAHVDVTKPDIDQWVTDPWKVTTNNKILYGNGVSWGKGHLLAWFHVIEAYTKSGVKFPVNVKFIIESMNRQNSRGLEDFLMTRKQDFLCDIDYVVVTDSEWLGEKHPCLSYGCIGTIHMAITIEKTDNSKTEPIADMTELFTYIVNAEGDNIIPKLEIYVQQVTPDEEQIYAEIADFNMDEIRDSLPESRKDWDKVKLLMHYWRLPSILVDEIEECNCTKKLTTKEKVKRQFIMKIVPNQIVDRQIVLVERYIKQMWEKMGSKNTLDITVSSSARPWLEDCKSPNYEAARRATIQIYKEDPSMIREDRHLICINILRKILEKSILLLPLGNKNINAGRPNESMTFRSYYEGIKLLSAYLFQAALV